MDEIEHDEEHDESPRCPMCPGHGIELGGLGDVNYFRCRVCGWEWGGLI